MPGPGPVPVPVPGGAGAIRTDAISQQFKSTFDVYLASIGPRNHHGHLRMVLSIKYFHTQMTTELHWATLLGHLDSGHGAGGYGHGAAGDPVICILILTTPNGANSH